MPCRGSRPPGRSRPSGAFAHAAAETRAEPLRGALLGGLHPALVLFLLRVDVELLLEQLAAVHLRVDAVALQQTLVGTALDDAAVVQDEDLVGVLHRRDAMCDDDARALLHDAAQAPEDLGL